MSDLKHLTEDERLFYASIQLALRAHKSNARRVAWTNDGLAHMAEIMGTLDKERAELAALKERLRGLERWRIVGGRSAIYRNPYPDNPQQYEWQHAGEVIRAADLDEVVNNEKINQ